MAWVLRFEALVRELSDRPGITMKEAVIGPPTDAAVLEKARQLAGEAWPKGMTELYTELSSVDIAYEVAGSERNGGAIHIPTVTDVWDHAGHEDEFWFDWMADDNPEHPFMRIRPIDRFIPEAYAVLYPVPSDVPATVHYHYCGEELIPTGLSYERWLELLLRSRGANYWLTLATAPRGRSTWVGENIDRVAKLFPDFDPDSMSPEEALEEIDTD
jgi:hypothetical protein